MKRTPKILVLAGSIRSGAYSQQTADAYVAELVNHDCEVTRITLADYELPIILEAVGSPASVPENANKLARQFDVHDAVVIVTPEYNGSLPPLLKNTIDWISQVRTVDGKQVTPYRGKVCAIASSSPGAMGGIAAIGHLREILVRLGMLVISEQLAVGNALTAFDEQDRLVNERSAAMLADAVKSLVEKAAFLS